MKRPGFPEGDQQFWASVDLSKSKVTQCARQQSIFLAERFICFARENVLSANQSQSARTYSKSGLSLDGNSAHGTTCCKVFRFSV